MSDNQFTYKYSKGNSFILTITDKMPKQSSLENEDPVYYTNMGIPISESDLNKLTTVSDDIVNRGNFIVVIIDKSEVDFVRKEYFSSWSEAYTTMVNILLGSYTNSKEAEEAFLSGEAVLHTYSAINGKLDIRILELN